MRCAARRADDDAALGQPVERLFVNCLHAFGDLDAQNRLGEGFLAQLGHLERVSVGIDDRGRQRDRVRFAGVAGIGDDVVVVVGQMHDQLRQRIVVLRADCAAGGQLGLLADKPRRDAVADERDVERAAHDAQQQQQAERDAAYAPVVAAGQQTPDPALDEAAAEGGDRKDRVVGAGRLDDDAEQVGSGRSNAAEHRAEQKRRKSGENTAEADVHARRAEQRQRERKELGDRHKADADGRHGDFD